MSDEMTVLRDQGAQNWYQLRSTDVAYLDDLRGHVIRPGRTLHSNRPGKLPGRSVGDNLDQVAAGDRDITVHLED
jgi:hypothetical protein